MAADFHRRDLWDAIAGGAYPYPSGSSACNWHWDREFAACWHDAEDTRM